MENHVSLSRVLAYYLRHKPNELNLELNTGGWVDVNALISGMKKCGHSINKTILFEIVNTDNKNRYSLNRERTLIRANQGHSVPVNMNFVPQCPPDFLYHGTSSRFIDKIMKDGLQRMTRNYVHLSADIDTARAVGTRHGGNLVIITIDTKQYKKIDWYISENGVWLVKYLPPTGFTLNFVSDTRWAE